ncbi:MAG: 3'-5' exonuclease [Oscillospiraceae bacterium]|nr:3'-5' exonuclease [Oscillospiraceae bacterium]
MVEFACARLRGGAVCAHYARLCRPLGRIRRAAAATHGITEAMTADCPTFAELLPSMLAFIGKDTVICHNAPFDMGFLKAYCARAGIDYSPRTADTLILARRLFPGKVNHSLAAMAERLGVTAGTAHRALADALTTAQVYVKLLQTQSERAAEGGA